MEKIRSCPICPVCGSKKFDRLKAKDTVVRCAKCGKELTIWFGFCDQLTNYIVRSQYIDQTFNHVN